MIEFPRKRALLITYVVLGALFILVGLAVPRIPIEVRAFFGGIGAVMAGFAMLRLTSRMPRFRATAEGVSVTRR